MSLASKIAKIHFILSNYETMEDFIFDSGLFTESEQVEIFRENKDDMNLQKLFTEKTNIPDILVEESVEEVGANLIAKTQTLTQDYIRDNVDNFNIDRLIEGQDLPEDIIERKLQEGQLKMEKAVKNKVFSMEFLQNHISEMGWFSVCVYQFLSEDFMREHSDDLDWGGYFC